MNRPCRSQQQWLRSPSTGIPLARPSADTCPRTRTRSSAMALTSLISYVSVPSRTVLSEEGDDLVAAVAWPRFRGAANWVVVAVGFPERRGFRRERFRRFGPLPVIPPRVIPPHDFNVLLRHRPRSISLQGRLKQLLQRLPGDGGHARRRRPGSSHISQG